MKQAVIFILSVICMASVARQIKSASAARKAISAIDCERDEIPYVTSGLIAMWDGEWNAGIGQHDSDAIIWKDLVGDFDLVIYGSVFHNFIRNSNTSAAEATGTIEGIGTIEVCYRYSGSKNSSYGLLFYSGPINATRLGLVLYLDGFQTFSNVYWKYSDVRSHSLMTISATKELCYVDGTPLDPISRATDQWNNYGHVGIGGRAWQNTWQTYGDWHCIRIYNRTLSEEEIAFNSSIDKERFGP